MNNINNLQEQFENLIKQGQELLEKMKENQNANVSKKVRVRPFDGDLFYFISEDVDISYSIYDIDNDYHERMFLFGNCFKTEEEAQKELDRRLAEQELLDLVDAKTSDENYKWFIEYDPRGPAFYPNNTFFRFATPFLFSSKELCQKAIDTLGTEKLRLIFRIG